MCLQGHLCYRGHLSLSVLQSINLRLEGNWHFCCLTFNAACLVSDSGVVGGGCPRKMSLGRSIVNAPMSGQAWHPHKKPTASDSSRFSVELLRALVQVASLTAGEFVA